jgi:hypothetical protein
MTQNFGNAFLKKPSHKHEPVLPEPVVRPALGGKAHTAPKPAYAKIFRWRLPEGRTQEPATVEIIGTFTNWQKVPLTRGHKMDGWQVTVHDVPAHKTHHYMLLVDGQPAHDKNSDGLAVPHGPLEKRYQLMTDRGPRLFMLFAQTK